ncbi:MAG: efflux RND transporter periplasmic adaptor subunit [Gammaproteobacteria bacterium]|jgi:RND family efflux transporter MFP subunit
MIKAMMIKAIRNKIYVIGALVVTASVQADAIPEIDCLIEPNMVIELSSPVSGVLDSISVDRSDAVNQGQIVATLKSDVEQVKLRASQETLNLSKVEQKRSTELYRDSAITLSEKEQSDHEVAISELEVESARANLELRNIRSPIDGVVADRYLMPGEFIEDKPLLKIAQLDPLRVEVVAPVTYFGRVRTGMHAQVKTEFGSFDNLVAEVVVVDKVIDAASGTFGIRLELQNKDYQIPGGLKCSVRFFDEQEEAEYANLHTDGDDTAPVVLPAVTEQDSVEKSQHAICRRIGPFGKKDKVQALMVALENDISAYQIQEETSTYTSYRVITEPPGSREAAKQIETEMKQAGVKDIAVVKRVEGYSLSLGLFRKEQSAVKRQSAMKALGYDSEIAPLEINKSTYWAEIKANMTEDELSERVTAAGIKGSDNLLFQSCNTEILASGR